MQSNSPSLIQGLDERLMQLWTEINVPKGLNQGNWTFFGEFLSFSRNFTFYPKDLVNSN